MKHMDHINTRTKLLPHISRQYGKDEMIVDLDWLGSEFGLFHEAGFGTDMGLCDWITPNATTTNLRDIQPGSQTGASNGLTLVLDAEIFDYGLRAK